MKTNEETLNIPFSSGEDYKEYKNKKTDKRQERRGGFYWFDNKPYVTVTTAIKILDKPALRYWFGREVYRAMVVDPTLGESEALSAPYKKSEKAKARGTTVHSIVEAWKASGIEIDKLPEDIKPYATAFYNWVSDNKVTPLEHEKTVVSEKYKYAGTIDLIAKRNGDIWIIDVKTGKDIYPEAHIQVSAYKQALEESGQKVQRTGILLLKDNGKYKFEESDDNLDIFLHAKEIWKFINKELCEKVGYE